MIPNRIKGQRALVTGAIWCRPEAKRPYRAAGAGDGRQSGIGRARRGSSGGALPVVPARPLRRSPRVGEH
jgi:hypothetical protein